MLCARFIAILGLSLLASASDPPCGEIDKACSCPSGSTFRNASTRAVIGASAKNIGIIMNDYFNVTWAGLRLVNSTGENNVVGAIRAVEAITGSQTVVEELIVNDIEVDGSFVQRFSQVLVDGQPQIVVPAGAPGGPLGLHGYWSTLVVKQTKGYNASECSIYWNEYRCDIGHPFDTAKFQAYSINSTISILQQEGKINGRTIYPYGESTTHA